LKNVTAVISMLHEVAAEAPGNERCSATRLFRGQPVLSWTLDRLTRSRRLGSIGIVCWDDQLQALRPLAEEAHAVVLAKGERIAIPEVEAVAAAQRWAEGWRGGLLATCHFDLGFYGPWHQELAQRAKSAAVLLVDPAAALIDPQIVDSLIAGAEEDESLEFCFAPAAPGLGGVLLRMPLLARLAAARAHPGRLLHYHPDQNCRELIGGDHCVSVPTPVARTLDRFTLDSDRQVNWISAATESLNGQLASTGAEDLVFRAKSHGSYGDFPREIVLELNTRRSTRPIFCPGSVMKIDRGDFAIEKAKQLFRELAATDGTRLTLAGVGDPLLAPDVFTIIDAAKLEGGLSIHVETDLHELSPEAIARLAVSPIDVVSIHVPSLSSQTYQRIMGCDAYLKVVENIRRLVTERQARKSALPIIVPIFTKCRDNFGEMEVWYDQWIRAVGSALVRSPGNYGGRLPDVALADMTPPGRKPCQRLASRLTILSDGRIVSCEQDVLGEQSLGTVGEDSVAEVWRERFGRLRADHAGGCFENRPVCSSCREWHRP
jgi:radical SAM protein with 4Fe4S-binding SPASM domain